MLRYCEFCYFPDQKSFFRIHCYNIRVLIRSKIYILCTSGGCLINGTSTKLAIQAPVFKTYLLVQLEIWLRTLVFNCAQQIAEFGPGTASKDKGSTESGLLCGLCWSQEKSESSCQHLAQSVPVHSLVNYGTKQVVRKVLFSPIFTGETMLQFINSCSVTLSISLDGRRYLWMCRTFSSGVQCDTTTVAFISHAQVLCSALFTLQTGVQLLPEEVWES